MGLDCKNNSIILNHGGLIDGMKWYDFVQGTIRKPDVFDNIENVFFNSKKGITVIKWKDGSMSKSTCDNQDKFDPFVGFCIAYTTKGMSKSKLKERIQRKFKKNNNG